MTLTDKLAQILDIIKSTEADDPMVSAILMDGFGLSLNLIAVNVERAEKGEVGNDISQQLEMISRVCGISLEDVVRYVIDQDQTNQADKPVDQATLEFITSDLDDYEKFLAQNKAKEDLDFLNKVI